MNCPKCGSPNAYVGLSVVECSSMGCEHFKPKTDYVGAFPIRQEITVLPADDPRKLRLGFVIREYSGQELYRVKKDFAALSGEEFLDQINLVPVFPESGKPGSEYFETIKSRDGIAIGDRVVASGLFRWTEGVITGTPDSPRFDSGGIMAFLSFGEDDRGCWVATCWSSKAAMEKMRFE